MPAQSSDSNFSGGDGAPPSSSRAKGLVSGEKRLPAHSVLPLTTKIRIAAPPSQKNFSAPPCHRVPSPNAPLPAAVLPLLRTRWLGHTYHYLKQTASTNAALARLAAEGAPSGTTIVAEQQTAGRGRMARNWHSPAGTGLYLSLLLRPQVELALVTSLPLVVGVAVAESVARYTPAARPMIKWPNDVLVGGRKLCGILCEMSTAADGTHHLIVGIGLNINNQAADFPPEVRQRATSLQLCSGRAISRPHLLADLLLALENSFEEWQSGGLAPFMERLAQRDLLKGRQINIARSVAPPLQGMAAGINADGSLALTLADGSTENVYSGDAHIGQI